MPMALRVTIVNGKKCVSSYALYRCLVVSTATLPYFYWLKTRILKLVTLESGVDYIVNTNFKYEETKTGPKPTDYYIPVDIAKAICIYSDTVIARSIKKTLDEI